MPSTIITIGGTDRTSFVALDGQSIRDILNDSPNTMTLTLRGLTPVRGQDIRVMIDSVTEFAGTIQAVDQVYEGDVPGHIAFHVTCVDYTWLLDSLKVSKLYTAESASDIAEDLIASFTSGFTATNVAAGLPTIDEFSCTDTDVSTALSRLATLVGGYWKVDYDKDVHFFLEETGDEPAALDSSNTDHRHIAKTTDISQIRTRVRVEGGGSAAGADVAPGITTLPVTDASWFSAGGGTVKIGPQRVTYTGKVDGLAGAQMGTTAMPTNGPTVVANALTGLSAGAYGWEVTFGTGAGETLPSPATAATIGGVMAAPNNTPNAANPTAGGNVNIGTHQWAYTLVTAGGETTQSASVTKATTQASAPSNGPTPSFNLGAGNVEAGYHEYAMTFVTASGETTASPRELDQDNLSQSHQIEVTFPTGPAGTTARKIYRTIANNNGGQLKLLATISNNSATTYVDNSADPSLGANVPTSNTTGLKTVALSDIGTGPAGTTARKIYRTAAGGSQLKLLTTLNNNTTTVFSDSTADASLGANVPTTNTTATAAANLSNIPTGPSGTTSRKIYRTVANGSSYLLQSTIGNNTTTTLTDQTADGSLGAAAPTTDTSGLVIETGNIPAGSTTIPVTSSAPFLAAGGWAYVGTLPVMYTGLSGLTLTGIPATGSGALGTSARYGSIVIAASMLTGIPASGAGSILYDIHAGDDVNVYVTVEDLGAQVVFASLLGFGYGVREHFIQDRRWSLATATAVAEADLARFKDPETRITYQTRDPLTRSGKIISVNLGAPTNISGEFLIQTVTITEIGIAPGLAPLRSVTASTMKFSFEDLLRRQLEPD